MCFSPFSIIASTTIHQHDEPLGLDLAQRLSVARLLDEGEGYQSIREATGASSATISRVNKCYEYGSGGYRTVLERLKDEKNESKEKKG